MSIHFLNLEYFFNLIYRIITGAYWPAWLTAFLLGFVFWWRVIMLVVIPLCLAAIIYLSLKINKLRREETKNMRLMLEASATVAPPRNERWERVLNYLNSENPSDWKLAIIEADNILDAMVKELGYTGENLGERMKQIEPSDFTTLQDAWEAHKIRNRIAHESDFQLNRREVTITIDHYKKVFEEFSYI